MYQAHKYKAIPQLLSFAVLSLFLHLPLAASQSSGDSNGNVDWVALFKEAATAKGNVYKWKTEALLNANPAAKRTIEDISPEGTREDLLQQYLKQSWHQPHLHSQYDIALKTLPYLSHYQYSKRYAIKDFELPDELNKHSIPYLAHNIFVDEKYYRSEFPRPLVALTKIHDWPSAFVVLHTIPSYGTHKQKWQAVEKMQFYSYDAIIDFINRLEPPSSPEQQARAVQALTRIEQPRRVSLSATLLSLCKHDEPLVSIGALLGLIARGGSEYLVEYFRQVTTTKYYARHHEYFRNALIEAASETARSLRHIATYAEYRERVMAKGILYEIENPELAASFRSLFIRENEEKNQTSESANFLASSGWSNSYVNRPSMPRSVDPAPYIPFILERTIVQGNAGSRTPFYDSYTHNTDAIFRLHELLDYSDVLEYYQSDLVRIHSEDIMKLILLSPERCILAIKDKFYKKGWNTSHEELYMGACIVSQHPDAKDFVNDYYKHLQRKTDERVWPRKLEFRDKVLDCIETGSMDLPREWIADYNKAKNSKEDIFGSSRHNRLKDKAIIAAKILCVNGKPDGLTILFQEAASSEGATHNAIVEGILNMPDLTVLDIEKHSARIELDPLNQWKVNTLARTLKLRLKKQTDWDSLHNLDVPLYGFSKITGPELRDFSNSGKWLSERIDKSHIPYLEHNLAFNSGPFLPAHALFALAHDKSEESIDLIVQCYRRDRLDYNYPPSHAARALAMIGASGVEAAKKIPPPIVNRPGYGSRGFRYSIGVEALSLAESDEAAIGRVVDYLGSAPEKDPLFVPRSLTPAQDPFSAPAPKSSNSLDHPWYKWEGALSRFLAIAAKYTDDTRIKDGLWELLHDTDLKIALRTEVFELLCKGQDKRLLTFVRDELRIPPYVPSKRNKRGYYYQYGWTNSSWFSAGAFFSAFEMEAVQMFLDAYFDAKVDQQAAYILALSHSSSAFPRVPTAADREKRGYSKAGVSSFEIIDERHPRYSKLSYSDLHKDETRSKQIININKLITHGLSADNEHLNYAAATLYKSLYQEMDHYSSKPLKLAPEHPDNPTKATMQWAKSNPEREFIIAPAVTTSGVAGSLTFILEAYIRRPHTNLAEALAYMQYEEAIPAILDTYKQTEDASLSIRYLPEFGTEGINALKALFHQIQEKQKLHVARLIYNAVYWEPAFKLLRSELENSLRHSAQEKVTRGLLHTLQSHPSESLISFLKSQIKVAKGSNAQHIADAISRIDKSLPQATK